MHAKTVPKFSHYAWCTCSQAVKPSVLYLSLSNLRSEICIKLSEIHIGSHKMVQDITKTL